MKTNHEFKLEIILNTTSLTPTEQKLLEKTIGPLALKRILLDAITDSADIGSYTDDDIVKVKIVKLG